MGISVLTKIGPLLKLGFWDFTPLEIGILEFQDHPLQGPLFHSVTFCALKVWASLLCQNIYTNQ